MVFLICRFNESEQSPPYREVDHRFRMASCWCPVAIPRWTRYSVRSIFKLMFLLYINVCTTNTGGGLPVGSVLLIEEDKYVVYSKALHRYFLGEGAVHKHQMLVVNLDEDPKEFVRNIFVTFVLQFGNLQPCLLRADQKDSAAMPGELLCSQKSSTIRIDLGAIK